jgi:hypothetical protein
VARTAKKRFYLGVSYGLAASHSRRLPPAPERCLSTRPLPQIPRISSSRAVRPIAGRRDLRVMSTNNGWLPLHRKLNSLSYNLRYHSMSEQRSTPCAPYLLGGVIKGHSAQGLQLASLRMPSIQIRPCASTRCSAVSDQVKGALTSGPGYQPPGPAG